MNLSNSEEWRGNSEEVISKNPSHLRSRDFWWPGRFARSLSRRHALGLAKRPPEVWHRLRRPSFSNLVLCFAKIKKQAPSDTCFFIGDPDEIRTRVTAVKGRCLRPLDHRAVLVAAEGVEPTTLRVWTECSSQLSYAAILSTTNIVVLVYTFYGEMSRVFSNIFSLSLFFYLKD